MPFYFYTIVLGMVIGAVITWFLVADHPFESREAPGGPVDALEAGTIASQLKSAGAELDEPTIERVLQLHGAYVVGETEDLRGAADAQRARADTAGEAETAANGDLPAPDGSASEAKMASDKES